MAFSCKGRGFCPSCGGRRIAETATYLVDEVIPKVPVRQWVLSLPIPLRLLFAAYPELLTPTPEELDAILQRIIHALMKQLTRSGHLHGYISQLIDTAGEPGVSPGGQFLAPGSRTPLTPSQAHFRNCAGWAAPWRAGWH